jgi:transposase InsO family protein
MYSSSFPKLSQHIRKQIYNFYLQKQPIMSKKGEIIRYKKVYTKTKLADLFGTSRQTIGKIINNGKNGDFTIHKPINKKYLNFQYFSSRMDRLIRKKKQKADRKDKREQIAKTRYEHKKPGDLGHMDLKLLPPILGEKVIKGEKEYLLTLVDDCTRTAYFIIIQGKNQHQTRAGLEKIFARCPISSKAILSDNGKEFKGVQKHENGHYKPKAKLEGQKHQVEILLEKMDIKHRYTKVRRPQTNGKVERLNRTISQEFLTKIQFENRVHREAELRLYEYYYNRDRPHQGIKNLTPHQKLIKLSPLKFV